MTDRSNRTWGRVWIVGASSGIGRALAQEFASAGVEVLASARRAEELGRLALSSQHIIPQVLDVTQPDAIKDVVERFKREDIFPDLTIYCAASYVPGGLSVLTLEDARDHMSVNYLGAVGIIEALTPHLKQRGTGGIAIVSSLTSYCGLPMASLYGPTKAALASLCETLKPEFDQMGLDLFLINPGFVATEMTNKNTFAMPFLMSADEAAKRIVSGVGRSSFEIAFPFRLAFSLRILRRLPYWLFFQLTGRLVK